MTSGIADWVTAGGTVFVSAGGGLWDEANATNTAMQQLLGIKETGNAAAHVAVCLSFCSCLCPRVFFVSKHAASFFLSFTRRSS